MSEVDKRKDVNGADTEARLSLPAELAELEGSLKRLEPKGDGQLTPEQILAAAITQERHTVERATKAPAWSHYVMTALVSSALTATLMFFWQPTSLDGETVRINAPKVDGAAKADHSSGKPDGDAGDHTGRDPLASGLAWIPPGSRAARLSQLDRLLTADADLVPLPDVDPGELSETSTVPSVLHLRQMLDES